MVGFGRGSAFQGFGEVPPNGVGAVIPLAPWLVQKEALNLLMNAEFFKYREGFRKQGFPDVETGETALFEDGYSEPLAS